MPAKKRQTGKKTEFAYTITDKAFPEFKVLNTANAWWLDKRKVENLISAFKIDATVEEAIVYAGIAIYQYRYFTEEHPDFSRVKDACKELPILKARKTVVEKIGSNYSTGMDYLSRKRKGEFSPRTEVSQGTPKQFTKDAKERAKKAVARLGAKNTRRGK